MSFIKKNQNGKLRAISSQAAYLPRALRMVWSAAPNWTVLWAILLFVQGILPAALVYLTKQLVDSLVAALKANAAWTQVRTALLFIILTAVVLVLTESLQSVTDWVRTAQSELIQDYIKDLVHRQSMAVDMTFYESPEFYDSLDQARGDASNRPLALLESFGALFQNGLTLLAMATILIPYGVWLPFALFISTLPAFYVVLRFDRRYHKWWQETTTDRRWAQYYDVMMTHSYSAAELRLFGLGGQFRSKYQNLRRQLRTERLKQMQQQSIARLGAGLAALLIAGAVMVWMGWRALHGLATLGDLALFYQAFSRGQGLIQSLLSSLGKIYTNSLFLGNLFKFLELKPRIAESLNPRPMPKRLEKGIEFRQITFRYPGSERPALQHFNLFIPAGKVVAIVGANGAGKTTLMKLLCRFYDPEEGCVELDGIDLRDLSLKDLWRQLTVLFQNPVNYHASASESIAMSDFQSLPDTSQIEAAARCAGAHDFITRLPQGYDTLLGKWFGTGAELSGGEWQRVATARAYLRHSSLILLDEPTSFMDSWSEADWFNRFRELAQNRTAIVITHRFTIAMRADIIHVMDQGEVVESGSHQELLAREGLYAQSWAAQMKASASTVEGGQAEDKVLTVSQEPQTLQVI